MPDALLIVVSCGGRSEAMLIAQALLERRLAACVQLDSHDSVYRWQGAIELAAECRLSIKTLPKLLEAVFASITELHSYDLPVIEALNTIVDEWTMAWLERELLASGAVD